MQRLGDQRDGEQLPADRRQSQHCETAGEPPQAKISQFGHPERLFKLRPVVLRGQNRNDFEID